MFIPALLYIAALLYIGPSEVHLYYIPGVFQSNEVSPSAEGRRRSTGQGRDTEA